MLRTKRRLSISRVNKVDASINYINSHCYRYQELRDVPLKQLSEDAFDYIVNALLYDARIDGDDSVSSYFVIYQSLLLRAIDLYLSNLDFEVSANLKSKCFHKLLWDCNKKLNILLALSRLCLEPNDFGFELAHFEHHKLVSDSRLKALPLLTEVFSIKAYKLVSVSTYLVRNT